MDPAQRKPAEWNRSPLPHVRRVVAVASGKGGVGKSTTTVNLGLALAARGQSVGILDADIHGPSIPRMLGIQHSGQPEVKDGLIIPITGHGIRALSMGNLSKDQAAIWRGPMVTKALVQMLRGARWGTAEQPLDWLLIDMPPGTGDTHISLVQQVPLNGAIIVTTPQEIATIDAEKCLSLFQRVEVPILGIVENMSYFIDPAGQAHAIFGEGGGVRLAEKHQVPFLGQIPLDPAIRACADVGKNYADSDGQMTAYQTITGAIINAATAS
jgi:ATP-binding protein involved in chromosome partitioning